MPKKGPQKRQFNQKDYEKFLAEMDKTAKLLVGRDLELSKVKAELDEKICQLKEDEIKTKEMNEVLEIKLRARTRELRENISSLDDQIKVRTKKLENSKTALMNILEDFKKQKTLKEEEQKKSQAIINNFPDGLLIFDNENKLLILNVKAKEYLKISDPEHFYREFQNIEKNPVMKDLTKIVGSEIKIVARQELKMGPEFVLEVSVQEYSEKGVMYGKFLILHDITREKKIQSLKTEFVSIAAHQLRTPLSAIKWALTTLLDEDFGKLNDDQKKYLGKANLSNERMINLVDDLLNLSRIEEGKYVQAEVFLRVEDLTKEVLEEEELKAKKKNISLIFTKENDMSEVFVDKEKIKLVIQNLVENAINYAFKDTKVNISVTENKKEREIQFKISDTGIGVSEKSKERIFTKFFRAENAVRSETVGSGLGLFINKNIIESHGGKIWFDSNEKGVTTFYFTLPVKDKVKEFLSEF